MRSTKPRPPSTRSMHSVEARGQVVENALFLLHLLGPAPYASTLRPLPATVAYPAASHFHQSHLMMKAQTPPSRSHFSASHLALAGMPPLYRIPRTRRGPHERPDGNAPQALPQSSPAGSVPSQVRYPGFSGPVDTPASPVTAAPDTGATVVIHQGGVALRHETHRTRLRPRESGSPVGTNKPEAPLDGQPGAGPLKQAKAGSARGTARS
jgi:hypothetical protein